MVDVEKVFPTFYIVSEDDLALWIAIEPTWVESRPIAWVIQHEDVEVCSCFTVEDAIEIAKGIIERGKLSLSD